MCDDLNLAVKQVEVVSAVYFVCFLDERGCEMISLQSQAKHNEQILKEITISQKNKIIHTHTHFLLSKVKYAKIVETQLSFP